MKKMSKVMSIVVVVALCAALFAGCTTTAPAEDSQAPAASTSAESAAPSAEASTEGSAEASQAAGSTSSHEIYSKLPNSALSGVVDPNMPSRADVDKAWPKTPKDPNKIVIGWTEINQDNDWFIGVRDAAVALCDQYGFQLNFMNADNDVNTQSQHIDTFISQGVDIIVVDPINNVGPVEDIKRAVEAGIPVVCIGTVPEDCPILTTVAPNGFELGFESGQYIAKQFDPNEEIISSLIIGVMGSSASESRLCGMISGVLYGRAEAKGNAYASKEDAWLEGFNAFSGVQQNGTYDNPDLGFKIVAWGTGNWTVEGGLAAAEDIITAHGSEMNLIMPDNDFMAVGAITALRNAGLQDSIKIGTSADGTVEGMDMIKSGELLCTGAMSGPQAGAAAVEFINDIFNEGYDPSNLPLGSYFPANIITAENIDEFYPTDKTGFDAKFYKTPQFVFPKTVDEIKAEASK